MRTLIGLTLLIAFSLTGCAVPAANEDLGLGKAPTQSELFSIAIGNRLDPLQASATLSSPIYQTKIEPDGDGKFEVNIFFLAQGGYTHARNKMLQDASILFKQLFQEDKTSVVNIYWEYPNVGLNPMNTDVVMAISYDRLHTQGINWSDYTDLPRHADFFMQDFAPRSRF